MASPEPTEAGTETGKTGLSNDILTKLDQAVQNWDVGTSELRRRFDASEQKWGEIVQPLVEAIGESERLSVDDLAVRINTRD